MVTLRHKVEAALVTLRHLRGKMTATLRVATGYITMVLLHKHPERHGLPTGGTKGMPGCRDTLRHGKKAADTITGQAG